MKNRTIPFHIPYISGKEISNLTELVNGRSFKPDGSFSKNCEMKIASQLETAAESCLLTSSGTHALEMAALLLDIGQGDEIIIPAYTHYSTANAFLLRGAAVVCVDIDPVTLNIDPEKAAAAVTKNTRAVVPVHYGGVSCDMGQLQLIAEKYGLDIIEDAALSFGSTFAGKKLGTIGTIGCLSFHSAKILTSGGEGGAILLNRKSLRKKAEIIREMGTDRADFFRNTIPEYTWQGIGSSYLMNELSAAFLSAQLDTTGQIIEKRRMLWNIYHEKLAPLAKEGLIKRTVNPDYSKHNAHIYFIRTPKLKALSQHLRNKGIETATHYKVLPDTPFGKNNTNIMTPEPTINAAAVSKTMLRLPLYPDLTPGSVESICREIANYFKFSLQGNHK